MRGEGKNICQGKESRSNFLGILRVGNFIVFALKRNEIL